MTSGAAATVAPNDAIASGVIALVINASAAALVPNEGIKPPAISASAIRLPASVATLANVEPAGALLSKPSVTPGMPNAAAAIANPVRMVFLSLVSLLHEEITGLPSASFLIS